MSDSPRKQLGLIGLGAFGRLAAEHLRAHFDVLAADAADRAAVATDLGIGWGSIEEAAARPWVVLAVPVQSFAAALTAARAHLRPGTLVLDVASVKVRPVAAMERLLPDDVEIIGTHPMFGPQSAAAGIEGHRIVVCPVRTTRQDAVCDFLRDRLGLRVHVCDADTHDREIAQTQALAQFVGRALAHLDECRSPVRTPGYDRFREVAATVGEDSWELFAAIQNLNPYAAGMRAELLEHLRELQERLAEEPDADDGAAGEAVTTPARRAEPGD